MHFQVSQLKPPQQPPSIAQCKHLLAAQLAHALGKFEQKTVPDGVFVEVVTLAFV